MTGSPSESPQTVTTHLAGQKIYYITEADIQRLQLSEESDALLNQILKPVTVQQTVQDQVLNNNNLNVNNVQQCDGSSVVPSGQMTPVATGIQSLAVSIPTSPSRSKQHSSANLNLISLEKIAESQSQSDEQLKFKLKKKVQETTKFTSELERRLDDLPPCHLQLSGEEYTALLEVLNQVTNKEENQYSVLNTLRKQLYDQSNGTTQQVQLQNQPRKKSITIDEKATDIIIDSEYLDQVDSNIQETVTGPKHSNADEKSSGSKPTIVPTTESINKSMINTSSTNLISFQTFQPALRKSSQDTNTNQSHNNITSTIGLTSKFSSLSLGRSLLSGPIVNIGLNNMPTLLTGSIDLKTGQVFNKVNKATVASKSDKSDSESIQQQNGGKQNQNQKESESSKALDNMKNSSSQSHQIHPQAPPSSVTVVKSPNDDLARPYGGGQPDPKIVSILSHVKVNNTVTEGDIAPCNSISGSSEDNENENESESRDEKEEELVGRDNFIGLIHIKPEQQINLNLLEE